MSESERLQFGLFFAKAIRSSSTSRPRKFQLDTILNCLCGEWQAISSIQTHSARSVLPGSQAIDATPGSLSCAWRGPVPVCSMQTYLLIDQSEMLLPQKLMENSRLLIVAHEQTLRLVMGRRNIRRHTPFPTCSEEE